MGTINYKNSNGNWSNLILDFIYPVGSYYFSNSGSNISESDNTPANYFGGSWVNITGRFLYCNNGNDTGGSNDMIIPYHNHGLSGGITKDGSSHAHSLSGDIRLRDNSQSASYQNGTQWYNERFTSKVTVSNGGAHTHTHNFSIDYAGSSGNTINANMPAYRSCWAWYRTA